MYNEVAVTQSVNWLIHACVTPGCQVTIRVPVGEQNRHGLCKWCRDKLAYNTRDPIASYASSGPFLSRDEFGQDLFEAIKAQAGSIQAYKKAGVYETKGMAREAQASAQAAQGCQKELTAILARNTITVEDVKRILAMQ